MKPDLENNYLSDQFNCQSSAPSKGKIRTQKKKKTSQNQTEAKKDMLSLDQKWAVVKYFGEHIDRRKLPLKLECEAFLK